MAGPDGSLDPGDWPAFRALCHDVLDETLDWLAAVRERPVWRGVPAEVEARFRAPLPDEGIGAAAVFEEFKRDVRPYVLGTIHPRWWGYVAGAASPVGALAEFLTGSLNVVALGGDQAPAWVERQVLAWANDMVGFPEDAGGVLVNGASNATFVALAVASRVHGGPAVGDAGVAAAPGLVLYGSDQTHSCVRRAVDLLGLGKEALRLIPADAAQRLDPAALAAAVARDRAAGLRPFAVVGNAGTVDTGALDPLAEIADVCAELGLWLHVDGALGAPLALSPRFADLRAGLARADSIAFDYHKWLQVPFSAGCVLVKDGAAHKACFHAAASYTTQLDRGLSAGDIVFRDWSPDLSRPFWALKIWMTLKAHGARAFVELFDRNLAHTRRLAALVEEAPDLELLAPAPLNVVCFRHRGPAPDLDAFNRELLMDLQEGGRVVFTHTYVGGRFALRACIANHRTRDEDVDLAVAAAREAGAKIVQKNI